MKIDVANGSSGIIDDSPKQITIALTGKNVAKDYKETTVHIDFMNNGKKIKDKDKEIKLPNWKGSHAIVDGFPTGFNSIYVKNLGPEKIAISWG